MKTTLLFLILLIAGSSRAHAESRLAPAFEKMRQGKSVDEALLHVEMDKLDLAEESPAILAAINGNNPYIARRAAGAASQILLSENSLKTKIAARALAPAIAAHYNDPDPDVPNTRMPTNSWKQAVIYFFINSDAEPTPGLLKKVIADLNTTDDEIEGLTPDNAALFLAHLKPLPPDVLDVLLARMGTSPRAQWGIMYAFQANRVTDPRAIAAIQLVLETPAESNESRRLAAQALAYLGPAAKVAIPALRRVAKSPDGAGIDSETRGAAERAISQIEQGN